MDIAVGTILEEAGHPIETIRGGGGARAPKGVTLASERLYIAVPSRNSIRDGGVGLGWFVDPRERTGKFKEQNKRVAGVRTR